MKETIDALLALLKSAMGNGELSLNMTFTEAQWDDLFAYSKEQGVAAVAFEEIMLHAHNMPFKVKMEWAFHSKYIKERRERQMVATAHLSDLLASKGIRMMLLKGNGLSLLYPHPECRECGDIDIYCFDDYEAVNNLVNEVGIAIEGEDEKHSHFTFEGISVENHRKFNYDLNKANKVISRELVNGFDADPLTDERIPNVYLPNLNINALYVMQHSLNHLPWTGLSLRNLLDWMMLLTRNHASLDWDHLDRVWKASGEKEIVSVLTKICIDYLGMPSECFHVELEYDENSYKVILYQILNPWKKSSATPNKLRKFYRKLDQYRRRRKAHLIVYKEPFPDTLWDAFFKHG